MLTKSLDSLKISFDDLQMSNLTPKDLHCICHIIRQMTDGI